MTGRSLRRVLPLALVALGLLAACNPEGSLDSAQAKISVEQSTIVVGGWAFDRNDTTRPVDVHIYVGAVGMAVTADDYRPDVDAAYPGYGKNHGFNAAMNVAPGRHEVCVYAINLPGTPGDNTLLQCKTVEVKTPTTTTAPTTTTTAPPSSSLQAWQTDVMTRVNAKRSAEGAAPLTACTQLQTSAQSYADTMAANQWFDSVGPDGSDTWVRSEGYGGTVVGETLSFGYANPTELVGSVMGSGEQSGVVLDDTLRHLGMGRTWADPDGSGPMSASYYWVLVVGAGGSC
jgi:uncharacterized protein YkwD